MSITKDYLEELDRIEQQLFKDAVRSGILAEMTFQKVKEKVRDQANEMMLAASMKG